VRILTGAIENIFLSAKEELIPNIGEYIHVGATIRL